jgi:hypothetical protein
MSSGTHFQNSKTALFCFLQDQFLDGRDRNRALNGSTRSLASTHPMLATTTISAPGFGGHFGGQSPDGTLRHHLTGGTEGISLSSKVHTVILTGTNNHAHGSSKKTPRSLWHLLVHYGLIIWNRRVGVHNRSHVLERGCTHPPTSILLKVFGLELLFQQLQKVVKCFFWQADSQWL